jgi:hypothetical protein
MFMTGQIFFKSQFACSIWRFWIQHKSIQSFHQLDWLDCAARRLERAMQSCQYKTFSTLNAQVWRNIPTLTARSEVSLGPIQPHSFTDTIFNPLPYPTHLLVITPSSWSHCDSTRNQMILSIKANLFAQTGWKVNKNALQSNDKL